MRIRILVLCGLCTLTATAQAAVFRCQTAGAITFQDRPCREGTAVVPGPTAPAGSGLRDSERRWLRQRARQKERPRSAHLRHRRDEKAQERRCWARRTRLDEVKARLRSGYRPAQGDRLRRRRRVLEDYLARFCD